MITQEQLIASIKMPLGAWIEDMRFEEERIIGDVKALDPVHQAAHVVCWTRGQTEALALAGAEAVLAAVDGKETIVRVMPEAEMIGNTLAGTPPVPCGYVRFSFFDKPGTQTKY